MAAQIVGDESAGIDSFDLIEGLTRLVDRSLVTVDRDTMRYRMLETIRQYAREKVVAAGEAPAVADRHLAAFAALAGESEAPMRGPNIVDWLDRLDAELDNLGSALEWGMEADPWTAVQMAVSLLPYWGVRVMSQDNDARIDRGHRVRTFDGHRPGRRHTRRAGARRAAPRRGCALVGHVGARDRRLRMGTGRRTSRTAVRRQVGPSGGARRARDRDRVHRPIGSQWVALPCVVRGRERPRRGGRGVVAPRSVGELCGSKPVDLRRRSAARRSCVAVWRRRDGRGVHMRSGQHRWLRAACSAAKATPTARPPLLRSLSSGSPRSATNGSSSRAGVTLPTRSGVADVSRRRWRCTARR